MIGLEYTWRDVWPRRKRQSNLPPGQRMARAMPRFGVNPTSPPPAVPEAPALVIKGDVAHESAIALEQLSQLDRVEIHADFHCVTTWTVTNLHWSGWLLRDVWEHLIIPQAQPSASATHLRAIGGDRYTSGLGLEDALADEVLIADRLEGRPLDVVHGAPLRLVAPAHYGYKNVKHLVALSIHIRPPRTAGGNIQHPRARVRFEERHGTIAGRLLRWPYRLLIIPIAVGARRGGRAQNHAERGDSR